MLSHGDIWWGIDRLAADNGFSPSGLARRAGLDPTSFNISKRINPHGKPRWPTTESISKILEVTQSTLADFVALIGPNAGTNQGRLYPVISLASAAKQGIFNKTGYPMGSEWGEIEGPNISDELAYALQIVENSMVPTFRMGDIFIVSPAASIQRHDRVIVKTNLGEVIVKEFVRQTHSQMQLRSVNTDHSETVVDTQDVSWMHRILWASQ